MDEEPASYYLYLHQAQLRFSRAFKLYEGQFHWAVNQGDQAIYSLVSRGMAMITEEERQALRDKWFSHPFEFRPYLHMVLGTVLAALGVVAVAGLWIRLLRRSVRVRTAEILSKHHQLEEATDKLRKEEALLRTIIDSSPDAMALKSPQGVYLDCNAGLLALLNRTREQVVGHTDDAIYPDKDFVSAVIDHDQEVLRNGKPLHYEVSMPAADGAVRDIEVFKVLVQDINAAPAGVLTVARDVTERRRAERELRISSVAFETHDGMMITDANGVIDRVNAAFSRITGYTEQEAVGRTPRFLQSGLHPPQFYQALWSALKSVGYWQGEVINLHRDGQLYTAHLSISEVTDAHGQTMRYVCNLQDITATKAAHAMAERLKLFDPLTDLPNRLLIEKHMAQCDERHVCGAVMMIDIDFFQNINDSLGHGIGDRLLIEVARRIRQAVREGDTLGRFSGDNFVLVAENLDPDPTESANRARALAQGILQSVEAPVMIEGHRLVCTVSIGITLLCEAQVASEVLLRRAELAMYKSKAEGRNTLRFFEESMQSQVEHRSRLERELREAIEQQQFVLHYQLQVDACGRPTGAEALIRWMHPQRGLVPPGAFIPLAEETGLIEPIGRWCLQTACQQLAQWSRQPLTNGLTVAVNISPRQFRSPHFVDTVVQDTRRADASPHKVKLEVTESLAIDDLEDSMAKLQALKAVGFQISLDDFGTGNSSLNVLTKLPLTQLKIDKSFVDNLPGNHRDAMVAQTIVNMGQGLGLHVIAEGVETPTQYHYLKELGCSAFQGYYFGKPMPVDAFEASLLALQAPVAEALAP